MSAVLCKVHFTLQAGNFDEHTPPPHHGGEGLWAELLGDGTAKLLNIPFVIKGVSYLDHVRLRKFEPEPGLEHEEIGPNLFEFDKVIEHSGRGTVRIICRSDPSAKLVSTLDKIKEMGCGLETSRYRLAAIDIPRDVVSGLVLALLEPIKLANEIFIDIGFLPEFQPPA